MYYKLPVILRQGYGIRHPDEPGFKATPINRDAKPYAYYLKDAR